MPLPSPASRMLLADFPQQHVLRLTLHRPDARNAYNAQMVNELAQWLAWSEQEIAIRTVILTGSGTVFCSGADLQEAFTGGGKGLRNSAGGWSPLQHLPRRKIWIAALNGHAYGGGLELALSCDFILAAEQAKIALPEVQHGLLPLGGAIEQLAKRLPVALARQLLLAAEPLSAARALAAGLFSQVVPQEQLPEAALALAARLNRNAPLAVQACNALLQAAIDGLPDRSDAELRQLQASDDYQESLLARSERRQPNWQGR
ncbi:enoyl-CoA hydratase/isomerase family protein [Erwinia sp. E602]|uniref:enoyl-CoA hydratase/isomerase family protein n=1 Tax=Erwinia sp. E602 TaxID=2675378 RepID=UPI001BAC51C4|nr:enoyl-CoA hydratase/isomerase family protein [Erwinia sp. E602]QUG77079.1 enoyl-CoA hydratase/isomerase family protein [Erwinia sp. E602]